MDNSLTDFKKDIYEYFLNGNWVKSKSGKLIEVKSPIDDSIVGNVQSMTIEEVDAVIRDSKLAFSNWKNYTLYSRSKILHKAEDILCENAHILSDLITYEIGKPKLDAYNEVVRTVDLIHYFAEEGVRVAGEVLESGAFPNIPNNKVAVSRRSPLGVVLAIPPFNYPINESIPKIVAALITGNTVILKPSTQGSISGLFLVEIFRRAGLPAGVLNVVTGSMNGIGDFLVSHPLINAINFTGSYKTAQHIHKIMQPIKFLAGLNGKDAAIVLEDADLDLTAKEIADGAFAFSGQRCNAIKRVIVVNSVADQLVEKLKTIVASYKVGDVRNDGITHGPVIYQETVDYVMELIKDAQKKGCTTILGGNTNGKYMDMSLLDHVTEDMRIAWEEPFGPVLPILRVNSIEEAIEMVNKSEYGLQCSLFTKDIHNAFKISNKLDVGSVNINAKDSRGPDNFPFTGIKHSGLGYVGGAKYLIQETTVLKTIIFNI